MRLPQDRLSLIKNYVHAAQGVIIAVAWLMCIIIFTRQGDSDGRIGWYFGLVSHQSPATMGKILLTMVSYSVLVIDTHSRVLGYGPDVVSSTTLFEYLRFCCARRRIRRFVAQCVGSCGFLRVRG